MNASRKPLEAKPPRMSALARLPVFLALDGKRAVLAGGSPAAAWKAELLSACGAHVDVYAVDPCDELLQLAADPPRGTIAIVRRDWTAEDLKGAVVAVGAFEDDEGAARFSSAARTVGVPVN
ncbi:MAG: NAD(P)-dependent oxidoreductase, partial [Pseudolabrys sp.]